MQNILLLQKKFVEEVNSPLKGEVEKHFAQKNQIHLTLQLSIFSLPKILSKRIICIRIFF
jgi:hypothetical protein